MRRFVVVPLVLLTLLPGISMATEYPAASPQITVPPHIAVLVPNFLDLPTLCGTKNQVYACTRFLGQRLTCQCERAESGWLITPAAQFIPYMYLSTPGYLTHELRHVGDVRTAATNYLQRLASQRFGSAEECEDRAGTEMKNFRQVMDSFSDDSNAKRHPTYERRVR